MKILVVEDEKRMAEFVSRALVEQAYTLKVVSTCSAARDAVAESPYDAIVLDLGLPDGDGLALLAELRRSGFSEPVLILSARDSVRDRVTGLNLGADDYLPKPFSVDELIARVRSLLRRHHPGARSTILEYKGLRMDLLAHTFQVRAQSMPLTGKEFALMELFMANPGRVLTRTFIAEKVWENPYDMETNLIDVYIRRLRQKFVQTGVEFPVRTLRGTGYQLP